MDFSFENVFDYENGFYLTASVARISKFATHLELYRRVSGLAGEIVECGVFKGASLSRWVKFRTLFDNAYAKKIIAFDIFGEFPETDFEPDKKKRAQFIAEAGSKGIAKNELEEVYRHLNLWENLQLVAGDINKTVPDYLAENPQLKISLLHVDVDLYAPTKTVLEQFYPHVVRGGIIILDDYGAFAGANKAIDDFFSEQKLQILKLPYSNAISYVEKQ